MGIMSGIGGLVGGLSGLFGGNSMPQAPPQFQMPNQYGAATNAFNSVGNLSPYTSGAGGAMPFSSGAMSNIFNNPGAGAYTGGAGTAMGMGQQAGLNQFGAGGSVAGAGSNVMGVGGGLVGAGNGLMGAGSNLMGMGSPLFNAGNQWMGTGSSVTPMANTLFNMGLDPQSQLYQFAQNQNLQQTQAIEAGAGLATTPYGAGVSALSNQQFNMNWENQQLQRAIAGAQGGMGVLQGGAGIANTGAGIYNTGAGVVGQGANIFNQGAGIVGQGVNAIGQGGNMLNMGTGMQGTGANTYGAASAMPYNAFNTIGQNQQAGVGNYLSQLGAGANIANMPFGDWMNYVGAGNQANSVANQNYGLQLQAQNQQFGQNMQLGGLLGSSLYGLNQGMFGGQGLGSMFGIPQGTNIFAPGGIMSSQPGYIAPSGDYMSAGQVTPG